MVPVLKNRHLTFTDLKSAGFDPDALWQRVEGDPELLRDLFAVWEQESPGMLARIRTAIHEHDVQGLERSSHKIKGSLLQFSAGVAAAAALRLEQLGRSGTVAGAGEFLHALQQEIELLVQSLRAMVERMANDRQTNDPRTNDQRMNDPRMTGDL